MSGSEEDEEGAASGKGGSTGHATGPAFRPRGLHGETRMPASAPQRDAAGGASARPAATSNPDAGLARALAAAYNERESELKPGVVNVWPQPGGGWVAGVLLDGLACFFIGGPFKPDYRVYPTRRAALAALASAMKAEVLADLRPEPRRDVVLLKPKQQDVGGGWEVFGFVKANSSAWIAVAWIVVGPKGPHEELFTEVNEALNTSYELARRTSLGLD